jgi:hypothetical protein
MIGWAGVNEKWRARKARHFRLRSWRRYQQM